MENERHTAHLDWQRQTFAGVYVVTDYSKLRIQCELDCELDGKSFHISSAGEVIVIYIPDLSTGLRLLRTTAPRGTLKRRLHWLKRRLNDLAGVIEVRIDGETVARFGYELGHRVWKLIGFPPVELIPRSLARSTLKYRKQ